MKYPPLPDGIIIDGRRVFTSFDMRDYAITFHNINTEVSINTKQRDTVKDAKVIDDLLNMFKMK